MPEDTAVIEAPATEAPPAEQGLSIDSMMANIQRAATTPEGQKTPEPEVKPDATPKAEPTKPVEKAKPTAKADEKPAATGKEDAGSLRRRLEEVSKSEKTIRGEMETLRKQNQELAGKKFVTPEIEKEIAENKAEIERYRQHLTESAYERSPEYAAKFKEPYKQLINSSVAFVTKLNVPLEDGTSRKGTQADLRSIANASEEDRAPLARQLFGDNALVVLQKLSQIEDLTAQSNRAIEEHAQNFEAKQKQESERWQNEQKAYGEHRETARRELVEKYPEFFGEDANDPEVTEALKKGFEFVDSAAERGEKMTVDERAAFAEVIRARAGAFPRVLKQFQKATTKISELETELKKYRASEPGGDKADLRGEKPADPNAMPLSAESFAERLQKAATGG